MAKVVFLDIDGVITDPEQLSIDFRTLPGEVLAPALGHTVADWGRAMGETYPAVFERHVIRGTVSDDPVAHFDEERRLSILAMCRCLGVDAPDDDEARRLGRAHNRHVRRHGDAPVADAAATIRKLATNGDVHLATGSMSWNALAVLDRIGVRELIGFPCGSDLVGVNKGFAAYYERLFAAVNVNPRDAIVAGRFTTPASSGLGDRSVNGARRAGAAGAGPGDIGGERDRGGARRRGSDRRSTLARETWPARSSRWAAAGSRWRTIASSTTTSSD